MRIDCLAVSLYSTETFLPTGNENLGIGGAYKEAKMEKKKKKKMSFCWFFPGVKRHKLQNS